jgi:hypothetical protein
MLASIWGWGLSEVDVRHAPDHHRQRARRWALEGSYLFGKK